MMKFEDYKELCSSFFNKEEFSLENIQKVGKEKTVEDFHSWYMNVINDYFAKSNPHLVALVKLIRGNFDCLKDDSELDPLKSKENQEVFQKYKYVSHNTINERFLNIDCVKKCNEDWLKVLQQKQREDALKIVVDNKDYIAINMCDILWCGWECDANAWIVEDEGRKKLVASNHGTLYFEDAKFLENKIKEYEEAIHKTKEMLDLLSK